MDEFCHATINCILARGFFLLFFFFFSFYIYPQNRMLVDNFSSIQKQVNQVAYAWWSRSCWCWIMIVQSSNNNEIENAVIETALCTKCWHRWFPMWRVKAGSCEENPGFPQYLIKIQAWKMIKIDKLVPSSGQGANKEKKYFQNLVTGSLKHNSKPEIFWHCYIFRLHMSMSSSPLLI